MLGPVLAQELLVNSRRGRLDLLRRLFAAWLILQFLLFLLGYVIKLEALADSTDEEVIGNGLFSAFITNYLGVLFLQEALLLLVATPIFVAGAITDEKSQRTLQLLLTADLSSAEIVLGKMFGRLAQVTILALCPLPFFCFFGGYGHFHFAMLLGLGALAVIMLFALSAASILARFGPSALAVRSFAFMRGLVWLS